MKRIYLDSNGETIKCENCVVGDKLMFLGEQYEVVDNKLLRKRIQEGVRYDRLVTTMVTDMSKLFRGRIVQYPIKSWDVSNVLNMSEMFFE